MPSTILVAAALMGSSVKRYDAMIASILTTAAVVTSPGVLCTAIEVSSA